MNETKLITHTSNNMKRTKLTIVVNYSLRELKAKYREFNGTPMDVKVSKLDVAIWLGRLAEADIMDLSGD